MSREEEKERCLVGDEEKREKTKQILLLALFTKHIHSNQPLWANIRGLDNEL